MTGLPADRHIHLLAPHPASECRERLQTAGASHRTIGVVISQDVLLFTLPRGLAPGRRFFIEGICHLVERSTVTEVDVTVGLTWYQKITLLIVMPFMFLGLAAFGWLLLSSAEDGATTIALLFAGYVLAFGLWIVGAFSYWDTLVGRDAATFESFLRHTLEASA